MDQYSRLVLKQWGLQKLENHFMWRLGGGEFGDTKKIGVTGVPPSKTDQFWPIYLLTMDDSIQILAFHLYCLFFLMISGAEDMAPTPLAPYAIHKLSISDFLYSELQNLSDFSITMKLDDILSYAV